MAIIDKLTTDFTQNNIGSQEFKPSSYSDRVVSFEEGSDPEQENRKLSPVVEFVVGRYNAAKSRKELDDLRLLRAYRNFRGLYGPDVQFTESEVSRVFIKVTKQKVIAAYAQIVDILFAGNKFPIGIEATPVPEGDVPESVYYDPEEEKTNKPGEAPISSSVMVRPELLSIFGAALTKITDKLKKGVGKTPTSQTFEPVKLAAKNMEKLIQDQLEESDASKHLRYVAFEMCLLGTGILKGPFATDKEYPQWNIESGNYEPIVKTIPKISSVSLWNFYPDPDAKSMSECEFTIERHKLSKSQLRDLKRRPLFRKESIDLAILDGYNYHPLYWESILEDNNVNAPSERYEVLEYWGNIDKDMAKEAGLDIPDELKDFDEFQVNIWICNSQVLRLVLNPFTPKRIPYFAVPYELNPYSFFGIGIAENMDDTQLLMNGFMRMAVDNAALSANVVLELDETNLVPGQDMKIYPGKMFRRQGGAPGQAIFSTKFQSVTQELMVLFDKARQLTDESTNMPSYSHGGVGVAGVGRTASGMSMLMGAAAQATKAIVGNIDTYLLDPMGNAFFEFNMQFNFKPEYVGDLSVVAKGTESLMRNEIRSQRLLQFMQTGLGNPASAPLVNIPYILRELATSLDLDEDKVVNDPRAAAIQAQLIKEMNPQMQGQGQPQGGANPQDPTGNGGGTVAPGNAPTPGADGFTGAGGGANGGQMQASGQPTPPGQVAKS